MLHDALWLMVQNPAKYWTKFWMQLLLYTQKKTNNNNAHHQHQKPLRWRYPAFQSAYLQIHVWFSSFSEGSLLHEALSMLCPCACCAAAHPCSSAAPLLWPGLPRGMGLHPLPSYLVTAAPSPSLLLLCRLLGAGGARLGLGLGLSARWLWSSLGAAAQERCPEEVLMGCCNSFWPSMYN